MSVLLQLPSQFGRRSLRVMKGWIAHKVRLLVEVAHLLMLLALSGFVFYGLLLGIVYVYGGYLSEVKYYEKWVARPGFRGRVIEVIGSFPREIGKLRFVRVFVEGRIEKDSDSESSALRKTLFIEIPEEVRNVYFFIEKGDSVLKMPNSDRLIIVKKDGTSKEGKLVKCIVELNPYFFGH